MIKKKDLKQFCKNYHDTFIVGRTNISGACKQCRKENSPKYNSKYYKTHQKDFYNRNKKRYHKDKKYSKSCSTEHRWKKTGMINLDRSFFTQVDYDRLYQIQQGKCKICKRHQTELNRRLSVDHNHKTGIVRGLLCIPCNTKLGHVEDRNFYKKAMQYLRIEAIRGEY